MTRVVPPAFAFAFAVRGPRTPIPAARGTLGTRGGPLVSCGLEERDVSIFPLCLLVLVLVRRDFISIAYLLHSPGFAKEEEPVISPR